MIVTRIRDLKRLALKILADDATLTHKSTQMIPLRLARFEFTANGDRIELSLTPLEVDKLRRQLEAIQSTWEKGEAS